MLSEFRKRTTTLLHTVIPSMDRTIQLAVKVEVELVINVVMGKSSLRKRKEEGTEATEEGGEKK